MDRNGNDCKVRKISGIPVKVCAGEKTYSLLVKEKESILDALMAMDASFGAVCGGVGRCGKCKIRVTEGCLPATSYDTAYFSKEEIDLGMRLSCKAYPSEPLQVELNFQREADFQAVVDFNQEYRKTEKTDTYGIAVDIGTTTIAIQLISLNNGERLAVHAGINHQRNYGADVISRIKAASEGKNEAMQASVRRDLAEGIRAVVEKSRVQPGSVTEVAIAGNTTMIHLLMGYDCKGLGEYPFTPVNIHLIEDSYENILADFFLSARVRILPGISAFVGGDIAAGLYTCNVDRSEKYAL
ncbi:MAG: 2Fe-2S iron-sulfur cluster binding domain-containing protein, partial [Roseburia sp.]|nr:2Fe-2S iron-sulfur cluster binding domain-containing protein [Roseburia sp.]